MSTITIKEISKAFGNVEVLKPFTETFKDGEFITLLGPSGCGKTTVLRLMSRLYDYDSGKILIDGNDIKGVETESLFENISIVFQEVTLFNTSILENIRFGNKNASDEQVKEAARLANCEEFIEKLPEKYDTLIGENGSKLSGGERQRLAMARALYQNREVLVLDEPTAALDALAEDRMYQEFNQMVKGKTAIFISHRLSSTRFCDKIVMFEDGRIIEEGTHEQLINANGKYRNMFQVQAQYYKDKEGEVC